MTATYKGLAVPLYQDSTSGGLQLQAIGSGSHDMVTITNSTAGTGDLFVIEDSDGTEFFYVEEDGVVNIATAQTGGGENAVALTVTDGSTITSGYVQGYYCSMTTSGKYTTGGAQINAFAVDLFLGGQVSCEAEGMYIYVAESGTPNMTGGDVSGLVVYIANCGTGLSYAQDLFLHYHMTDEADVSSYIFMKGEGGTSPQAAFCFHGQFPDYFVKTIASQSSTMIQNITAAGTTDKVLTCLINGSTYWIPLYAASA